jgi:hypothetical protein
VRKRILFAENCRNRRRASQDYIAVVAALPDGRLPIVRQHRAALENLPGPARLIDPDEDAAVCCRRDLMEETGFAARIVPHKKRRQMMMSNA